MKRRFEDAEALERRIQLYADRADLNQDVFTGEPHVNPKKKATKKKATKKKATKKKATKKKPKQLQLPLS